MMFKRTLLFLILLMFSSQMSVFAETKDVLVLYDSDNYFGDTRDAVVSISNLLKHFDKEIDYQEVEKYEGNIDVYEYVMILSFREIELDQGLMRQLRIYQNPILWIGKNINQLTENSRYETIQYGHVNNLTRVVYKDRFYDIGIKRYFEKVKVSPKAHVFSYLYDGSQKYPFILKEDNLYYVSRMDLNEPLFYIFADVLYDFLGESVAHGSRVFIKIADVNPYTDSAALLEKARFLLERDIPFAVSVAPLYREEGSRYVTPISEREDLVKVLTFIQENNQALIVQGGTQFFDGDSIEGQDYFEWRGDLGDPSNDQSLSVETWTKEFLNLALDECGYNELFPIGFEGSHYTLSSDAYQAVGDVFDLYVGSLQTNDWQKTITVYPWAIKSVNGIHQYVPDNLGFFSGRNTSELEVLKSNLNKMRIVSEFVGGISIAPDVDIRELEKLIHFLEDQQLTFYDLRNLTVEVRGDHVHVVSSAEQLIGESDVEGGSTRFDVTMNIIFAVVLSGLIFVFFLFFKLFRASKSKTDDNLF